jgi:hypothetical protein
VTLGVNAVSTWLFIFTIIKRAEVSTKSIKFIRKVCVEIRLGLDTFRYHKDDSGGTGEHVLSADGTVALEIAFNAPVVVLELNVHANVTLLAVEKVLAQSVANSTNPAICTVINWFGGVVVPELADVAVVLCKLSVARLACLGSRLDGFAMHTEHHLCLVPKGRIAVTLDQYVVIQFSCIQGETHLYVGSLIRGYTKEGLPDNGVVACIIVTEPAVEPFPTAVGLQLAASPVVLASQIVSVGIL